MARQKVFVHECSHCGQLVALHETECFFCRTPNDYFERELAVPPEAQLKTREFLQTRCKQVPPPLAQYAPDSGQGGPGS